MLGMAEEAQALVLLRYAARLTRERRLSWVSFLMFLSCLAAPILIVAVIAPLTHDQICPSCGGWGAGAAIVAMLGFQAAAVWTLVRAIHLPAKPASIILSAITCAIAALYVVGAVALYFAIQA